MLCTFRPRNRRRTTAVHLVAAGVDVTVIRSWLGYAHLDTTYQYARANQETRKALEKRTRMCGQPNRRDGNRMRISSPGSIRFRSVSRVVMAGIVLVTSEPNLAPC
jgi:hypothetical protein